MFALNASAWFIVPLQHAEELLCRSLLPVGNHTCSSRLICVSRSAQRWAMLPPASTS